MTCFKELQTQAMEYPENLFICWEGSCNYLLSLETLLNLSSVHRDQDHWISVCGVLGAHNETLNSIRLHNTSYSVLVCPLDNPVLFHMKPKPALPESCSTMSVCPRNCSSSRCGARHRSQRAAFKQGFSEER